MTGVKLHFSETALKGAMTMNCPQCSANNPDDAKFCSKCGHSLVTPVPEPAVVFNEPEKCPACKATRKEQAKFCGECGYRFAIPEEQVAAAVIEQVAEPVAVPTSTSETLTDGSPAVKIEPTSELPDASKEQASGAAPAETEPKSSNNLLIVITIGLIAVIGAAVAGWYLWSSKLKTAPEAQRSASASSVSAAASVPPAASTPAEAAKGAGPSELQQELDAYGNPVKPSQAMSSATAASKPAEAARKKKGERRQDATPHYPAEQVVPSRTRASIDEQHRQLSAAECPNGPGGLFCREKIRYRLCKNRWSASPAPGQSICVR